MGVGVRRDLRQVRNTEDLKCRTKRPQFAADDVSDAASDAGAEGGAETGATEGATDGAAALPHPSTIAPRTKEPIRVRTVLVIAMVLRVYRPLECVQFIISS